MALNNYPTLNIGT